MRVLFAKRHITFGPTTLLCLLTLFRVVKWQAYLIGYSTSAPVFLHYSVNHLIWYSRDDFKDKKMKKKIKYAHTPVLYTSGSPIFNDFFKTTASTLLWEMTGKTCSFNLSAIYQCGLSFFFLFFFLHTAKSSSVSSSGWTVWEHCCGKLMCARGIWHPCKVLQIMSLKMVIIVDLPLSFTPDFAVIFHPNEEATGYAKWTRCHLAQCVSSHVLYCYKTSEYKIWKGLIYVIKSNQSKDCREA